MRTMLLLTGLILLVSVSCYSSVPAENMNSESQQGHITSVVIAYLESLVNNGMLKSDNLQMVYNEETFVNPISATEADSAHLNFVHKKQLDYFIEHKDLLNFITIKAWILATLRELDRQSKIRQKVYEQTKDIYRPMAFVPILPGEYVSAINKKEFVISPDVDFQVTPVTQYQWASIMRENPVDFGDGSDVDVVAITGKNIRMKADEPVVNVSLEKIDEFIYKLNSKDNDYTYNLASINEYDAMMQKSINGTASYREIDNTRIWHLMGNLWQITRDYALEVFGPLKSLQQRLVVGTDGFKIRPIIYKESKSQNCGLRLVRRKKKSLFSSNSSQWSTECIDKEVQPDDGYWQWDDVAQGPLLYEDRWQFVLGNKEKYSEAQKRLIANVLYAIKRPFYLNASPGAYYMHKAPTITQFINNNNELADIGLLRLLPNLERLGLAHNSISDISPLEQMKHLKVLVLKNNTITDSAPLARLKNLTTLSLSSNPLEDIKSLSGLINLEVLGLRFTKIRDISPLALLPKLTIVALANNNISDVSPLTALTKLESLGLANNPITDLMPLKKLPNLSQLHLSRDQIRQFRPDWFLPHVTIYDEQQFQYARLLNIRDKIMRLLMQGGVVFLLYKGLKYVAARARAGAL